MTLRSAFEIIGPVMIGPSSSHTAGAVRIGRFARTVLAEEPVETKIILYGSFAKTHKGHGTDRAIVGGLMGMGTDDANIRNAIRLAATRGLKAVFETSTRPELHPNSVDLYITGISGKTLFIRGASTGGGNIEISRINHYQVNITGRYPTLLVEHKDKPGMIGLVTMEMGKHNINIGEMRMSRSRKGANNIMVIEADQPVSEVVVEGIRGLPNVTGTIHIEPFQE